jgi:hypothetical protein
MTQSLRDQDQFDHRPCFHFFHDPDSMRLNRPFCRAQFRRNLFVSLAPNYKVVNLSLTRGQRINKSAQQVQLTLELS